jgi:hypothetical protein
VSGIINVSFNEPHSIYTCSAAEHVEWVMGVYDKHGMRINQYRSVTCSEGPIDLDACARANAAYWPGNQVHLWLDTSLTPTEHLRDMPPVNGSSVGGAA